MDTITGSVVDIVYANEEEGFTVARLQTKEVQNPILITGILPSLQPGESLHCQGAWKQHPKYGKQFAVETFEPCLPSDLLGMQRYLESGMIKGIGPAYARKILDKFGLSTLEIMEHEPHRLREIEGIGLRRFEQILSCWQEQRAIRKVMIFLRGHEVSSAYAHKIYKTYRDKSIEKVSNDPFSLIKEFNGIGFKTADKIARSLGIAKDSLQRIDAGIVHLFRELSTEGHTCYPKADFIQQAKEILEISQENIEGRVETLIQEKSLVQESDTLWSKVLYSTEQVLAEELHRLCRGTSPLRIIDQERALAWVQEQLHITLAIEQKEALQQALIKKCLFITGGPGTGKSTLTKAILRIHEKLTKHILLAAPTGRAAKRVSEITHKKAFTIHALLEMDFLSKSFRKNRDNPLQADLLIVDECSMIDTFLFMHLLRAIPDHCRVIFIGDADQLPSVGPGKVLQDCLAAGTVPVFRLERIFRQAQHSRIVTNAHKINRGYMPDMAPLPGSDFLFFSKESPEEILEELLYQVKTLQSTYTNVQVLSPMKRGVLGTENLNRLLQNLLNPSPTPPVMRFGKAFLVHDKVMQCKNNYQKQVYNGDIGKILSLGTEEDQRIEVLFEERVCLYEPHELDELILAYAVSIHKYQGSECDCVILPLHTGHFKLLNKNLLYTAVTRGKKCVILIGSKKAVAIAVKNSEPQERHTGLCQAIQKKNTLA